MDVIKFINPTAALLMQQGEIINGITSKMWIERYLEAGEFKFVAPISSGLRTKLPVGCFVSHIDTSEVMIVENHEVVDNLGKEAELTITGRSFETILDNRIVGSNIVSPNVQNPLVDYDIPAGRTFDQVTKLINDHITIAPLINDDDALPYISLMTDPNIPAGGDTRGRKIKRGSLYTNALSILAVDNLGIKNLRPGPDNPAGAANKNMVLYFHKGVDRGNLVIFSYIAGEIVNADYLWSNRTFKNAALVSGKWLETVVYSSQYGAPPAGKEYTRRMMFVDGTDVDSFLTSPPPTAGGIRQEFDANMQEKGRAELRKHNSIALAKAEISKDATKHIYRRDYGVGDLVRVSGDYNESTTMRVDEYVEMEDETGESGYPTLLIEGSN